MKAKKLSITANATPTELKNKSQEEIQIPTTNTLNKTSEITNSS